MRIIIGNRKIIKELESTVERREGVIKILEKDIDFLARDFKKVNNRLVASEKKLSERKEENLLIRSLYKEAVNKLRAKEQLEEKLKEVEEKNINLMKEQEAAAEIARKATKENRELTFKLDELKEKHEKEISELEQKMEAMTKSAIDYHEKKTRELEEKVERYRKAVKQQREEKYNLMDELNAERKEKRLIIKKMQKLNDAVLTINPKKDWTHFNYIIL